MRLAFDEQIFAAQQYGGISRLFAELSKQFLREGSLDVELLPLDAPVVNRYLLDQPYLRDQLKVSDAGSTMAALARYFVRMRPRTNVDVIHNTFYLPHGLAGYPKARRVVTVHDMIPELLPKSRRRLDFITLKKRYVMSADHVICVSEATRNDMLRVYGDIKAPISVVHHGVDPIFRPGDPRVAGLPDRYLLFVGNRGQYKDANVLLNAFAAVRETADGVALVFTGGGLFTRAERMHHQELGIVDRVMQVSLKDTSMSGAYGNALMCVFPSRFEGFGLPALEAMACGTPALLAQGSSLPEVGGDAAKYFTPGDAQDLTDAIEDLLFNEQERNRMRIAGISRAQGFTWGTAAAKTAGIYQSLVG
ncbi:MAG: glycosyltransferase family 4 protein [Candidatus Nanopelagicales bacterium]